MAPQRIVSLLPAATELIYELGAQDRLYGVTHECSYPDGARSKPAVISPAVDLEDMGSAEIDRTVSGLAGSGAEIFRLDADLLREISPDLVIAQRTCEVCAAHADRISEALDILDVRPQTYLMDPHGLEDILNVVTGLAGILGLDDEGARIASGLEARIRRIRDTEYDNMPSLLAVEWLDPLYTAGHQIPELIRTAGAFDPVGRTGGRSEKMTLDDIVRADPDIIVLMPCGFGLERTIKEYKTCLAPDDTWQSLRAARDRQVYAVDADSYYSRIGTRTVTGLEILARIAHPETALPAVPDGALKRL